MFNKTGDVFKTLKVKLMLYIVQLTGITCGHEKLLPGLSHASEKSWTLTWWPFLLMC